MDIDIDFADRTQALKLLAGWLIDMDATPQPGPGARSIHWKCNGRRSVRVGY